MPDIVSDYPIIEAGTGIRLNASVTGTIDPETPGYKIPQGVVWKIIGVAPGYPLAIGTFIDDEGVLHVDKNEQNEAIYIIATSTLDAQVYGEFEVDIIPFNSDDSGDDSGGIS